MIKKITCGIILISKAIIAQPAASDEINLPDGDTYCVGNDAFVDFSNWSDSLKLDWGDGSPLEIYDQATATQSNPHVFNIPGVFTLTLSAYEFGYPDDFLTKKIYVGSSDISNFSHNYNVSDCFKDDGVSVSFTDNSILNGPKPFDFYWDFGDGNTDTTRNPTHIYKQPGQYTIYLNLGYCGSTEKSSKTITIISDETAVTDISVAEGCPCNKVFFYGTGNASDWLWDFGDGNHSIDQNTLHEYKLPGNYVVSLKGRLSSGCTNKKEISIGVCGGDTTIDKTKSSSRWYFGGLNNIPTNDGAGINFNTSPPSSLTDGASESYEGCATASDPYTGELLFYTSGTKVWNKNHMIMNNGEGLFGDLSSTQAALIIPFPGDRNKYYIFTSNGGTTGINKGYKGYFYSIVDLDTLGGLGSVTNKNTPLFNGPCTEIYTEVDLAGQPLLSDPSGFNPLVPHEALSGTVKYKGDCSRNAEYWVVIPACKNEFKSFLISDAGISSPITSIIPTGNFNFKGYSCFSPNGNKYAIVNRVDGKKISLMDFDLSTGVLSNEQPIKLGSSNGFLSFLVFYGICFSPDGNILYAGTSAAKLLQFDLTASNISSSAVDLGFFPLLWAIHMGSDKKLYFISSKTFAPIGNDFLSVINEPNSIGLACNITPNSFNLMGKQAKLGLQNIIPLALLDTIPLSVDFQIDSVSCSGTTYVSNSLCNFIYDSLTTTWDYGDGNISTFPTLQYPTHTYSSPGNYLVKLIVTKNCFVSDTAFHTVYIDKILPVLELGNDTILCEGKTISLNAYSPGASYLWQDMSTESTFYVSKMGNYKVEVKNDCGSTFDSININYKSLPVTNLNDTFLCDNIPISIHLEEQLGNSYVWQNGATESSFAIYAPGLYYATVTDSMNCYQTDSMMVAANSKPNINLGNDTILCFEENLVLDAAWPNATYTWNGSLGNSTYTVNQSGTYNVEVINECGKDQKSITVKYRPFPSINFNNEYSLCDGEILKLENNDSSLQYLWGDGSIEYSHYITAPGIYWVNVSDSLGCNITDTIKVFKDCQSSIYISNSFTPNHDLINDLFLPKGNNILEFQMKIFDRWGSLIFISDNLSNGWDGMINDQECPSGIYIYKIDYEEYYKGKIGKKNVIGSVTLIR